MAEEFAKPYRTFAYMADLRRESAALWATVAEMFAFNKAALEGAIIDDVAAEQREELQRRHDRHLATMREISAKIEAAVKKPPGSRGLGPRA